MPIELTDKNTRAVFGDYISVYDIQRAVEDNATVPIYYESEPSRGNWSLPFERMSPSTGQFGKTFARSCACS